MFDMTVIPYLVFFLVAIPPFFLGYFKGWRSGVFALILTMATGGILIGISIAIYDGTLWPLFKRWFVESHNPGNLAVEYLKDISKTSVISISVGIGLIPGILIMTGIYFLSKKTINKYMLPKLKKISNNEVHIIRKNLKWTRTGGVLLNGTAGLMVASAAAAAVSTLTIPSSSSNFFNSMTNGIASGMTFGQAQYNDEYQKMFEFVNKGTYYKDKIEQFRMNFGLEQSDDGNFELSLKKLAAFNDDSKAYHMFIEKTNNMASNSKDISRVLVLMFLNANETNHSSFNLVGFDKNKADGSKTNSDTVKENEDNIEKSLKGLDQFVAVNSTDIKWDIDGVKQGVKEFFESIFVDFEKSPYYQNWNDEVNILELANDELDSRRKSLEQHIVQIKNDRNTQTGYLNKIKNDANEISFDWSQLSLLVDKMGVGGFNVPTKPNLNKSPWTESATFTNDDTTQFVKKIISVIPSLKNINNSTSNGSYKKQKDAEDVYKKADQLAKDAEKITDSKKTELNKTIKDLDNFIAELEYSKNQLIRAQSTLHNAQNFLNHYSSSLSNLNSNLAKERNANNKLKAIQTKLANDLAALQNTDNSLATTLRTNTNELTRNQNELNLEKSKYPPSQNVIKTLENKIKQIRKTIDSTNKAITVSRRNLNSKRSEINSNNNQLNKSDSNISSLNRQINSLNSRKQLESNNLTNSTKNINNYKNVQIPKLESNIQNKKSEKQNKETYYNSAKSNSDKLRKISNDKYRIFDGLNNIYISQLKAANKLASNITNLTKESETKFNLEKTIEKNILKEIKEKIVLEANSQTKGSIKEQIDVVANEKETLSKLLAIKNEKKDLWNKNSKRVIEDITKALT